MKKITKEAYLTAYEILAVGAVRRDRDVILTRPESPCRLTGSFETYRWLQLLDLNRKAGGRLNCG